MTTYELPKVADDPQWYDGERDFIFLEGGRYRTDCVDEELEDMALELARLVRVQEFVKAESEKSKWDCAGERAYNAHTKAQTYWTQDERSWDEIPGTSRAHWIAVAKAVLDGEH